MADYFDCIIFKKTKNDKTIAVRIGSAKQRDDGGFQVYLDALPTGDGAFSIVPQRDRAQSQPAKPAPAPEMDDEIPF